MRRLLVLAAAAFAAVLMAVGAGASVGRDTFAGVWIGVETAGDGSTDAMTIGGPRSDGSRTFLYYETNASGYCGGGPLAAAGTAHADGDLLTVTITFTRCLNGSAGAFPAPFDVSMSATSDGRIDWAGVIFSRPGVS